MGFFRRRPVILAVRPARNYRAYLAALVAVIAFITALGNDWPAITSAVGSIFLGMVIYALARRR